MFLFCYALLCVHSIFAIILKRKRKLVALQLLSYICIVTINVLWLFLTVPWVGMRCVIVVFPSNTNLPFATIIKLGLVLKLLSAIVKLRHIQPSCRLWTIVDFCFVGPHGENFC